MENYFIHNSQSALIVGGDSGIGLELVRLLLTQTKATIWTTSRRKSPRQELIELNNKHPDRVRLIPFQIREENSYQHLADHLAKDSAKLDLLINCLGFLHSERWKPEKKISQLNLEQMMESFLVNTTVTPLLSKYLYTFFNHEQGFCICSLSAKVGSIEDNGLGGWYSYRSSKAALNMMIKNLSIEFSRKFPQSLVIAIHPGTTISELSKPFIGKTKLKVHPAKDTASNILKQIDGLAYEQSGCFLSWDGAEIPW